MRNVVRWIFRRLLELVVQIELRGLDNLPSNGAFVMCSNHLGMIDAMLLYYFVDRWDVFIAVAEKWEKVWFLRLLGRRLKWVFVDRFNPDLKAMRRMMKLMDKGNSLVIAPEGTRSRVGSMIEGRLGAAYLAAKLQRPIVPIGVAGTEDTTVFGNLRRFKRSEILINVGKPFVLPAFSNKDRDNALKEYTDEIMCRIAVLIPERYRGVYAAHPRLQQLLSANEPNSSEQAALSYTATRLV